MRARWYAAGGIVTVLVVGACSHSSGGGGSNAARAEAGLNPHAAAGAPIAAPSKPAFGGLARSSNQQNSVDVSGTALSGSGGKAAANALPLVDGAYKIEVARMTVAVKGAANVAKQANAATTIAEGFGGEVDRDDRTSGPHASAAMLLRVPPDSLDDALTQLSDLGTEKVRSRSTTDVTQKVADVSSRVASARQSIARLRVLFNHAHKVSDIIQLESELNSRESDLESLEAQQRALAGQTSMASITLSLVTAEKKIAPPKPAAKKDHDNAFVGGLKRGWDGFTAAAAWVAEAVGTLLPFLVLLLALGIALRLGWLRIPRRTTTPTPAPTPSE
jgi:hypothetical protein